MMMKNLYLFLAFITVVAPILLYTDQLGSYNNSSIENEFVEEFPTRELLNSRNSVRESRETGEEFSSVDSTERKTRVLYATDDGNGLKDENPIKLVTSGILRDEREPELIEEKAKEDEIKAVEQMSDNVLNTMEIKTQQQSAGSYLKADSEASRESKTQTPSDQTDIPDRRVRYLKDQLIRAKVYLGLGTTRNNSQFVRALRIRIKEVQRAVGDATKDSELPRNAYQKLKAMEQTLAKGKQVQDDCGAVIKKLRSILQSAEEQLRVRKKQTVFLTQLAAKTLPKGFHCLSLRLATEYFSMKSSHQHFQNQEKLDDPRLYHYALFSDNVLAAAVVVNSTISHAKEPSNHVFHIVTDRLNYAAMRMWFLTNPPGEASIEVQNIEELTWLNSSYSPILKQLSSPSMVDYYFRTRNPKSDSNLKFRNPKYLSILNYLRFYLPEIFPKLSKVLFLDDDIVVQKDLTSLWSLDLKGKVNGAVETCGEHSHRFSRYLNFSNPLISKKFDPHACGWAYGMNLFDLDEWKKQKITAEYHVWQKLNHNRQLWKLGSLPPGLITFQNRTFPLDPSWHVLGLGYDPDVNQKEIERAAVIHYNGNMKPWLEIGIPKYKNYWKKFLNYNQMYLRDCNISP